MTTLFDTAIDALKQQLNTPKQDLEKNLRAILNEMVEKMDLVSHEQMQRQQQALANAQARISELEQKFQQLQQNQKDN
ncbi:MULTISPECIES: accessory factor UbiK family protein [unclassified Acinetobacter]|uniref:accessory factor UbiK family protein n=1 Tax=unclassified Acinetobacter TaxID=196816 RepID=UPI0035BB8324